MKAVVSLCAAGLVAASIATGPALAKDDAGDIVAGIAIGVGVAALTAAAASAANADIDEEHYSYSHHMDGEGNAIAACTHKAWKKVHKDGARKLVLDKVIDTDRRGAQTYDVELRLRANYPWGKEKLKVACRVEWDRVTRFRYI